MKSKIPIVLAQARMDRTRQRSIEEKIPALPRSGYSSGGHRQCEISHNILTHGEQDKDRAQADITGTTGNMAVPEP